MRFFLGIDPGQSGGWAIIDEDIGFVDGHLFSEADFTENRCINNAAYRFELACLEKVHSMPGNGVSSMFKFGENFGWWQGVMDALSIPYELITPQRWMKTVLDSGDRSPEHRMAFAKRRWPDAPLTRKKDSGVADALCLAEYARRQIMGNT
jgi:hypothetical protein